MKIKPVLHRILVLPEQVEDTDDLLRRAKAVGIKIELDKREKKAAVIGTVVAIGNTAYREYGTTHKEEGIEIGSKILYAKYSSAEVPNSDLIVLNDEDIIGVIEND